MNKYVYTAGWIVMIIAVLIFSNLLSTHYQEELKNHSYAISSCEEAMQYNSDAIVIINYIKSDCANEEEVVRKCDRVIEYLNRSKDATNRTKDSLLRK